MGLPRSVIKTGPVAVRRLAAPRSREKSRLGTVWMDMVITFCSMSVCYDMKRACQAHHGDRAELKMNTGRFVLWWVIHWLRSSNAQINRWQREALPSALNRKL